MKERFLAGSDRLLVHSLALRVEAEDREEGPEKLAHSLIKFVLNGEIDEFGENCGQIRRLGGG